MFSYETIWSISGSIRARRPLRGPADVQIIPTSRCNAACCFCPLHAIPPRLMKHTPRFAAGGDLPGGLLDRLADDLYYLGGLKRLTITGGEPLLYSHLVPMVFQFARSFPEAELSIVTNGTRLKKFGAFLVHARLHDLHVSLNAGTARSYREQNPAAGGDTFDEIVAGIETVMKERKRIGSARPRVTLSVVLTRSSADDVEALFELGKRTGVESVTYVPLMEIVLDQEAVNRGLRVEPGRFQRFLDQIGRLGERARAEGFFLGYAGTASDGGVMDSGNLYRRAPCYSGYSFAAIYPNGDVRPCCHCEPVMGNLMERSFVEIWHSERYQGQRDQMMGIRENGGALEGCLCGECGYVYENMEFHKAMQSNE
ncbi:MAG TPA: radical SAM protein [bacterium]|nr:radical SAM protein [bacterium]